MKATLSAVALLIAISLPIMAQRTLPSDPLTKEENERLVNVATQYAISTQRLPRERSQWAVVGTELVDFKAPVRGRQSDKACFDLQPSTSQVE